jgi:hypothetical protein
MRLPDKFIRDLFIRKHCVIGNDPLRGDGSSGDPGDFRSRNVVKVSFNQGIYMSKLRILPGAAGVIALTASIGFIDGQREIGRETPARETITLVGARTNTSAGTSHSKPRVTKPVDPAYLVEIKRGDSSTAVLVDASTGRVLLS